MHCLSLGTSEGQSNTGVCSILALCSDQEGRGSGIGGHNRDLWYFYTERNRLGLHPAGRPSTACSVWELNSVGTENPVRCGSTVTAAPVLPWSSKLMQLNLAPGSDWPQRQPEILLKSEATDCLSTPNFPLCSNRPPAVFSLSSFCSPSFDSLWRTSCHRLHKHLSVSPPPPSAALPIAARGGGRLGLIYVVFAQG